MAIPTMEDARAVLQGSFGYESFRPGQERVVQAILDGRDALAVMPTGAGKSICYQIPAVLLDGLAIVVSPLVSLMGDQVRSLGEVGIRGSFYNSTLKPYVRPEVLRRAYAGYYDLMYVAPERLVDPLFREFAMQARISLVAVDEAHCVSQWGQDFRPAYRQICGFVEALPKRPVVAALTATATDHVRRDVIDLLRLREPLVLVSGFDRTNLRLSTHELTPRQRQRWIVSYLRRHNHDSGIIYAMTRKRVDELAQVLDNEGFAVAAYHAGYGNEERTASQESFSKDDARVMVATNAFGMGIDKSNVRYVINDGMPLSLEEYYQEAGRAGRDGEVAECHLLWSKGDIRTAHFLIDNTEFDPELTQAQRDDLLANRNRLLGSMIGYAMSTTCLRRRILRYFGQDLDGVDAACQTCSVCGWEEPRKESHVATADDAPEPTSVGKRRSSQWLEARSSEDEAMFERLRALRKRLADQRGVPPYVVFTDKTLWEMIRLRPQSEDELLQVSGVGKTKLQRYGADFLEELTR